MPDQISDHYSPAPQPVAATAIDLEHRPIAGLGHARLRYKRARMVFDLLPLFAIGDVMRVATFKSSDRISAIFVSSDGGGGALAADLGLYASGLAHDGAVVDADLFASALAIGGALARSESFVESGVLTDEDRGLTLWELANIGAATLTEDPHVQYDLAFTATANITIGDAEVLVEVQYTSGD